MINRLSNHNAILLGYKEIRQELFENFFRVFGNSLETFFDIISLPI